MASLDQAFNSQILAGNSLDKVLPHQVVGVLVGKVVNSTYYIYQDRNTYFAEQNGKIVPLQITKEDHNQEIQVPLIGLTYKVIFFDPPKKF